MIVREDGKIGYFSPETKQALTITREGLGNVFREMIKTGIPEIMPKEITGLGLNFGEMSFTSWQKFVSLAKRNGAEIFD